MTFTPPNDDTAAASAPLTARAASLAVAKGFGFALLIILAISLAGSVVLSSDRLQYVIREGSASGALSADGSNEHWVDCVELSMELTRVPDPLLNVIETDWARPTHDPCDELRARAAGPPYPYPMNPAYPYENYAFGTRHLQAIALSFLTFGQAENVYAFITYVSLIALFVAAWFTSRRLALTVVLPIVLCLLFAFSEHRWARSVGWGPPYSLGFAGLALMVGMPRTFASRAARLAFFTFVGVMVAYFDLLQGSLPVVLSLSIVINHFFFVSRRRFESWRAYWIAAAVEACAVFACFLGGFIALTALRMVFVLRYVPGAWQSYIGELLHRTSTTVRGVPGVDVVDYRDVLVRLWAQRTFLTGNELVSTLVLIASGIAWIVSAAMLAAVWRRLEHARFVLVDVLVLACTAGGFFVWFYVFQNQTYEHAWLMVRLLTQPAAYGFCAALVVLYAYARSARRDAVATRAERAAPATAPPQ